MIIIIVIIIIVIIIIIIIVVVVISTIFRHQRTSNLSLISNAALRHFEGFVRTQPLFRSVAMLWLVRKVWPAGSAAKLFYRSDWLNIFH